MKDLAADEIDEPVLAAGGLGNAGEAAGSRMRGSHRDSNRVTRGNMQRIR